MISVTFPRFLFCTCFAPVLLVTSTPGQAIVPRVAVRASRIPARDLSPLSYQGGFETKTLLFDPLVWRGSDGVVVGGLLERWSVTEQGACWKLTLRPGVKYHDGTEVTAQSVVEHFERWVRLPEHSWLPCNADVRTVEAVGDHVLRIQLDRPHSLLSDLCAINPCSIRGPGSLDRQGVPGTPIGSGPFRFVEEREEGRVLRLELRGETPRAIDLVRLEADEDAVDLLWSGDVDLVVDGWHELVDRAQFAGLTAQQAFEGSSSEGSSVVYLSFRLRGPTAEAPLRQRIAAAIDREELVGLVEHGHARACDTWAAPCVVDWPEANETASPPAALLDRNDRSKLGRSPALRLLRPTGAKRQQLAAVLCRQLLAAGIEVSLVDCDLAGAEDGWDLRLEQTWGLPYDPDLSLAAHFTPSSREAAALHVGSGAPASLRTLVNEVLAEPDRAARRALYCQIQAEIDTRSWVVPLYVPDRLAVRRAELPAVELGPDLYRTELSNWVRDLPVAFRQDTAPIAAQTAPPPGPTVLGAAVGEQDPTKKEVLLPAESADWKASLIIDNGAVGIWTVKPFQVLPQYGCPEIVGLDDQGRCLIMVSYSGKWTPHVWVHDGKWLGGLTLGDVDRRVDGSELYTGGEKGNLYQLTATAAGAFSVRHMGWIAGHEVHTIVVDPFTRTPESSGLLVFTRPGALYRVQATGAGGEFTIERVCALAGRIRDAVVLPAGQGHGPALATVGRAGKLELIESVDGTLRWSTIYETAMGLGRISQRRGGPEDPVVLYSTVDDGRVMRHEKTDQGWSSAMIYAGPPGPRGVAAGRFDADPAVESVAVFGYSARVELLSRKPGAPWQVETLFIDRDKGHWLSAAELDGRNGTEELVASGYGGRIVLLTRPPGYGLPAEIPFDDS